MLVSFSVDHPVNEMIVLKRKILPSPMQVMMIDVLLQNLSNETVFKLRQEEHNRPLTRARQNAYQHANEQHRHREKQAVVVEIQGERAEMLFWPAPALLQIVHIVVKPAFGEQRKKPRFLELAPRQHSIGDGVKVFEKLFIQKLVEKIQLNGDVE